jgi:hypothetical protein
MILSKEGDCTPKRVFSSPTKGDRKTKRERKRYAGAAILDYNAIYIYSHIFTAYGLAVQLPFLKVQLVRKARKPLQPSVNNY